MTLTEIAEKLGGIAENSKSYDEIGLTPDHVESLTSSLPAGQTTAEFAGIKVFASPFVPDGYGVLRKAGKVIGVVDFVNKTSTLISRPEDPAAF